VTPDPENGDRLLHRQGIRALRARKERLEGSRLHEAAVRELDVSRLRGGRAVTGRGDPAPYSDGREGER
jgi:hypothetical protein